MSNTRFATLIHILTVLAKYPDQWLSSEWIARSIQINPVIVRKELGVLQELGWVISKKGKEGGSMLNVTACDISLAEIYKAVKNSNVLGKKNECTNTACSIGRKINKELESLFEETDEIVYQALQHKTLKGFVEQFD
jgi:DNA-binding IscR family transcriptional regulator